MTSDVLERITDAFVALDREWRYTYVNQKAGEIFGRRPEDLLGRHIWSEFPEGVGQPFHRAYERAMAEQQPIFLEEYYPPYDRWFENRIYPSPDGLSVFFSDVTERHLAEQRLRESEERLRLALGAADQGTYDLEVETGRAVTSPEYATMLGYDPAEFEETNARWIERLHPDDRERVSRIYRDYIAGRLPEYRVEFRQRTRDGAWKWILSLGKVVERDAEGRPRRMLGTHTDITSRKQAEERILKLTRLYAVLSQTNQAIVREQDRSRLFAEVCRVAVERGGLRMAWMGLVDAADRGLRVVARHGEGTDYLDHIAISLDAARPEGRGPTASALRGGRHQICNDIAGDEAMRPWWDEARRAGFVASAAFPLLEKGAVVGALNLYAAEAGFFDEEMTGLLDEMAADLSLALDRFALAAERDATFGELRASKQSLERAEENARLGSWELEVGAGRWRWSPQMYRLFGLLPRGDPPSLEECLELVHPDDRSIAQEALARMARGEEPYHGVFRTNPREGPPRALSPTWRCITDEAGRAARFEGTLLDVTDLKSAEQALEATLAALPDLMFEVDRAGRILDFRAPRPEWLFAPPASFLGRTVSEVLPARAAAVIMDAIAEAAARGRHRGATYELPMPGGAAWFELSVAARGDSRAAEARFVVLARDVTERKRAEERLRRLSRQVLTAQEEERQRIARELHDEIGQVLTAVKIDLQSLERRPEALGERLARSVAQVDRALQEVRALSLGLRPPLLEEVGLARSLKVHVERRARDAGLAAEVAIELPGERLSPELEIGCYRIVQEAVTNVLRHAGARRLWVEMGLDRDAVRLAVRDDGRGFERGDPPSGAAEGAGLRGIDERVALLGGRLEIRSSAGTGTEVAAWLPLRLPGDRAAGGEAP